MLVIVALVMHGPYYDAEHVWDDLRHLGIVAGVESGRLSLIEHLGISHNEHLLPAWRLWYYVMHRAVGLEPFAWHGMIALAHGLSAVMWWLVLRSWISSRSAAFASLLWAGASIGQFDNPLIWIAASHLTFGIAFLSASIAAMATGRPSPLRFIVMGLCLTMSLLTMSGLVVLAWLPLVFIDRSQPWSRHQWVLLCVTWIFPVLCILGWQVERLRVTQPTTFSSSSASQSHQPLTSALALNVHGLGRLTAGTELTTPTSWVGASVLAAGVIGLCGLSQHRIRTLGVIGMMLLYAGVVGWARRDYPLSKLLELGRYHYVACLGWSLLLGIGWSGLTCRWPRLSPGLTALLAPLISLQLIGQWQQATATRRQFTTQNASLLTRWRQTRQTLHAWLDDLNARTTHLPMLPIPIAIAVTEPRPAVVLMQSFPEFILTCTGRPQPALQILAGSEWTADHFAAVDRSLATLTGPAARQWRTTLTSLNDWLEVRRRLLELPLDRPMLRVPDGLLRLGPFDLFWSDAARELSAPLPATIALVPESELTPEDWRRWRAVARSLVILNDPNSSNGAPKSPALNHDSSNPSRP